MARVTAIAALCAIFIVAAFIASANTLLAQVKFEIIPRVGHLTTVTSLAFTKDEKFLITGSGDGSIKIWEASRGALIRTIRANSVWVSSIALSRDDRRIYVGGSEKIIREFDLETGALVREFTGITAAANAIVLSPDQRILASADDEKLITLWRTETGEKLRSFVAHADRVTALAWSADGRRLVSGSADKTIKIWNPKDVAPVVTIVGHDDTVNSVTFSADGKRLLSAGSDGAAKVWDAKTGKLRNQVHYDGVALAAAVFLKDGRIATASAAKTVEIWDLKTGAMVRQLAGHDEWLASLTLSPDGQSLLSGAADFTARLWDVKTGKNIRTFDGPAAGVRDVDWSPDGSQLVTATDTGYLNFWDAATGGLVHTFKAHESEVWEAVWSPDSHVVASAGQDGFVHLWDAETGEAIRSLDGHGEAAYAVRFSPDGQFLLTGGADKVMHLWDVATGVEVRQFPNEDGVVNAVNEVAFSPDGRVVVSSNDRGLMQIWDAQSGALLRLIGESQFALGGNSARFIEFSPDGTLLLTSTTNDRALNLWNVETGVHVRSFSEQSAWLTDAKFSPDGRHIVSTGGDDTVKIWDASTGTVLKTMTEHTRFPTAVDYSPDGQRIVSSSSDASMRVWNAASGDPLTVLYGGGRFSDALALTPAGFFTVTGNGARLLAVVEGLRAFSVDQFYQSLYRPDLVEEMLRNDPVGRHANAAQRLNLGSLLATGPPPEITIEKAEQKGNDGRVTVSVTDRGGGIGKIEWRVGGRIQGVEKDRGVQVVEERALTLTRSFPLVPGERNLITITAYNAEGLVASDPVEAVIDAAGATIEKRGKLYVLAVGVDRYAERTLQLANAVNDARTIGSALDATGRDLFDAVTVTTVLDEKVNDIELGRVLASLAKTIKPEDKFVFFLAGHGLTVQGRYYFLPQDFSPKNGDTYANKGITQDRWQEWFASIKARSSVLLYDTCESGSLARAASTEKAAAMDRLTQAVGINVIAASDADQPASEGYRGHGLFTWAFLDGLAHADTDENSFVEIFELANHVGKLIPEISQTEFGFPQRPRIKLLANFPLGIADAAVAPLNSAHPEQSPVSSAPTHVVVASAKVSSSRGDEEGLVLKPGTLVRVVQTRGQDVLVARNGQELGFVPASSIAPIQ